MILTHDQLLEVLYLALGLRANVDGGMIGVYHTLWVPEDCEGKFLSINYTSEDYLEWEFNFYLDDNPAPELVVDSIHLRATGDEEPMQVALLGPLRHGLVVQEGWGDHPGQQIRTIVETAMSGMGAAAQGGAVDNFITCLATPKEFEHHIRRHAKLYEPPAKPDV